MSRPIKLGECIVTTCVYILAVSRFSGDVNTKVKSRFTWCLWQWVHPSFLPCLSLSCVWTFQGEGFRDGDIELAREESEPWSSGLEGLEAEAASNLLRKRGGRHDV